VRHSAERSSLILLARNLRHHDDIILRRYRLSLARRNNRIKPLAVMIILYVVLSKEWDRDGAVVSRDVRNWRYSLRLYIETSDVIA
jgi:hypothetical protein